MPPPHVFAHRYDVAISTACVVLDYIVVETEAGGKACIDYLRKHNLGRLSFIVLETMVKNWVDTGRMDAPIQVPAQAQRLFDLVTISEPRLRPAFYYALRDTMVIYRKPASKPPRTAPPRRPAAPPRPIRNPNPQVTSDLDTAVGFAYQGNRTVYRVVTLDGA